MSKHKEAFKRIKSVVDSHLLFSEWLQHKSNWGGYIKSVNNIDAELKFDEDMYLIDDLVDRAIPMKPIFPGENDFFLWECPSCNQDFISDSANNYCLNCGQALDWSEDE